MTIPSTRHWQNVTHADRHVSDPIAPEMAEIIELLMSLGTKDRQQALNDLVIEGHDHVLLGKLLMHRAVSAKTNEIIAEHRRNGQGKS